MRVFARDADKGDNMRLMTRALLRARELASGAPTLDGDVNLMDGAREETARASLAILVAIGEMKSAGIHSIALETLQRLVKEDVSGAGPELLRGYLREQTETQTAFATRAGVTGPQLSLFLSGHRTPALATALRIAQASAGAVPVESWGSK